jgi:hypothetical protein
MSREIKFRAFSGEAMHYGGFAIHATAGKLIADMVWIREEDPVMQYTGLKDAGNKDIYEGDLIHLYGYGQYQAEYPFIELFEAAAESDIGGILGNIHENPELLEQS